jgi:hypothetical protein
MAQQCHRLITTHRRCSSLNSADQKQDCFTVLTCIKNIVRAAVTRYPTIKNVIVQADNAACYTHSCLAFALYMILLGLDVLLESLIHTEAQDGKTSLYVPTAVACAAAVHPCAD